MAFDSVHCVWNMVNSHVNTEVDNNEGWLTSHENGRDFITHRVRQTFLFSLAVLQILGPHSHAYGQVFEIINTYIQTYIHTYRVTDIHTDRHTHTHIHAYLHTYTHPYVHTF